MFAKPVKVMTFVQYGIGVGGKCSKNPIGREEMEFESGVSSQLEDTKQHRGFPVTKLLCVGSVPGNVV
jgi:hypothetical protein